MSSSENEQQIPSDDDVEKAAEDNTDDEMTVCDEGTYDIDEEPNVNASATESDEDDESGEVDDEDVPPPTKTITLSAKQIKSIIYKVKEKYKKTQGLRLHLHFAEKLPDKEAQFVKKIKQLSELIIKGHRPNKKKCDRFCIVDFASTDDRNQFLEKLNKTEAETKIRALRPKKNYDDHIQKLIDKKIRKVNNRRANRLKQFSTVIKVFNLPASVSLDILKELFPDAVDIQLKPTVGEHAGKSSAIITLQSLGKPKAFFRRIIEFAGSKLLIEFLDSIFESPNKATKSKPQGQRENKEAKGAKSKKKKASAPNKSDSGSKTQKKKKL